MAWQLLAIWAIVTVTVVWFIRDERRLVATAELKRAARYYAHAPKYRHVAAGPIEASVAPAPRRGGGLSAQQRVTLAELMARRGPARNPDSP